MLAAHPALARLGLRPLGSVAPAASVGWVEELGVPLAPAVEEAVSALTALPEWVRWQRPTVLHCHHWRRAWHSAPLLVASWRQGQTCVASAGQMGATVSEQNPSTHARTHTGITRYGVPAASWCASQVLGVARSSSWAVRWWCAA